MDTNDRIPAPQASETKPTEEIQETSLITPSSENSEQKSEESAPTQQVEVAPQDAPIVNEEPSLAEQIRTATDNKKREQESTREERYQKMMADKEL